MTHDPALHDAMPHDAASVWVVDDDRSVRFVLATALREAGYEVTAFDSARGVLDAIAGRAPPELLFTDVRMPGDDGLALLDAIKAKHPKLPVIVMSAYTDIASTAGAFRGGAHEFLSKPFDLDAAVALAAQALAPGRARRSDAAPANQSHAIDAGGDALVGDTPAMQTLFRAIGRLAQAPLGVLITGETGTGKELVARALHFEGQRRSQPFIEVNCAAMPSHLLEAELFGFERGAFTDAKVRKPGLVEMAEGGTLFLDEIGEAEMSFQSKLLKVLEDKKVRRLGGLREIPVNFRVIAATNQDLERRVQEGTFRSDLYFRLRMMPLYVPPLRERGQDVVVLANSFLKLHGARYRKPELFLTPGAEMALLDWPWPGNVRELRNMFEHVVLMAQQDAIDEGQLTMLKSSRPPDTQATSSALSPAIYTPVSGNLPADGLNLEKLERECLVRALHNTAWNVTRAAKLLGLSRDTLRYRMEKHSLKNSN